MSRPITAGRRKHDSYPTPSWAADVLWRRLPMTVRDVGYRRGGMAIVDRPLTWAEPCVGDGALVRPQAPEPAWTSDIDATRNPRFIRDASVASEWLDLPQVDWIITNPPFNLSGKIVANALEHARVGVAMLLRLSFMEPTFDRAPMLGRTPPTRLLVLPRISFTGDGKTDSVTCAWMIWCKQPGLIEPGIEVIGRDAKEAA